MLCCTLLNFHHCLLYTVLSNFVQHVQQQYKRLPTTKENYRQGEDDEATVIVTVIVTVTAAIGEGNDCVGSICILLVLVCQRRKRNQINDIKLMLAEIRDGVRPAEQRCKCYCFYSYSTVDATPTHSPWTKKWRHSMDRDVYNTCVFLSMGFPGVLVIFNTHTILLTKPISSIFNWKSNIYKRVIEK